MLECYSRVIDFLTKDVFLQEFKRKINFFHSLMICQNYWKLCDPGTSLVLFINLIHCFKCLKSFCLSEFRQSCRKLADITHQLININIQIPSFIPRTFYWKTIDHPTPFRFIQMYAQSIGWKIHFHSDFCHWLQF